MGRVLAIAAAVSTGAATFWYGLSTITAYLSGMNVDEHGVVIQTQPYLLRAVISLILMIISIVLVTRSTPHQA